MSINVNGNSKQIDLQKLMQLRLNGKLGKAGAVKKAPGMSMNESIFNKNARMISTQNSVTNTNNTEPLPGSEGSKQVSIHNVRVLNRSEITQNNNNNVTESNIPAERPNIGNIDFDNLGSFSTTELASIQSDLKSLVDGDAPFFLRKPF